MGRMKELAMDEQESRRKAFQDAAVEHAQDVYDKAVTDYYEGEH